MEHYYLENNGYKKNTTHILCSKYTHPDLAQLVEHLTVVVNTNMYYKDIEGSPVRIR